MFKMYNRLEVGGILNNKLFSLKASPMSLYFFS